LSWGFRQLALPPSGLVLLSLSPLCLGLDPGLWLGHTDVVSPGLAMCLLCVCSRVDVRYCCFHLGDYQRALESLQEAKAQPSPPADIDLHIAACYYYLQMYKEAEEAATAGPASPLRNRLLFHCAHRLNNENKLMSHHRELTPEKEDQLTLAAIHYSRSHFQEVRWLVENAEGRGLVFVARLAGVLTNVSPCSTATRQQTSTSACCWRIEMTLR